MSNPLPMPLPTTHSHSPEPLDFTPLIAKPSSSSGVTAAQQGREDRDDLHVLVVTYNVNRYLISDSLKAIAAAVPNSARSPDLIAVALQEAAPDSDQHGQSQRQDAEPSATHLLCTTTTADADDDNNSPIAAYHARRRSSSSSASSTPGHLGHHQRNTRSHPNLSQIPTPAIKGLLTDPITAHWWLDKFICDLGCSFTRRAYVPLTPSPVVLGGTLLAVLVAVDVRHRIDDVRTSLLAVGPFGFPNKGAVGVSLLCDQRTRVAIVGAHLPHGTRAGPRDRALDKVVQGLVFEANESDEQLAPVSAPLIHASSARVAPATPSPPRLRSRIRSQERLSSSGSASPTSSELDANDSDSAPLLAASVSSPHPSPRSSPLTLADHHVTLLAGDLNYRTSLPTFAAATALLANRDWPALLAHDQLAHSPQIHAHGWREPLIAFGPTYRVIPVGRPIAGLGLLHGAASLLDTAGGACVGSTAVAEVPPVSRPRPTHARPAGAARPAWPVAYDPRRVPGWTDRVLVRADPAAARVHSHMYAAFPMLRQSDHVPVAALLRVSHGAVGDQPRELGALGAKPRACLWAHRASVEWTLWIVFVLESRARTVGVVAGMCVGAWVLVAVVVWVLGWM